MKHLLSNPLPRAMTVKSNAAGESAGRQLVVDGATVVWLQIVTGGVSGFIEAEALGGVKSGCNTTKTTACSTIRPESGRQYCASGGHDTGTGFCVDVVTREILIRGGIKQSIPPHIVSRPGSRPQDDALPLTFRLQEASGEAGSTQSID
jgi:hypothetical protein